MSFGKLLLDEIQVIHHLLHVLLVILSGVWDRVLLDLLDIVITFSHGVDTGSHLLVLVLNFIVKLSKD